MVSFGIWDWNCYFDARASIRIRVHFQFAAEDVYALGHVSQADSACTFRFTGIETAAVVADMHQYFPHVAFKFDTRPFGPRMFQDIVQTLLDDAVKMGGGV